MSSVQSEEKLVSFEERVLADLARVASLSDLHASLEDLTEEERAAFLAESSEPLAPPRPIDRQLIRRLTLRALATICYAKPR
jgi:hypothetical protein